MLSIIPLNQILEKHPFVSAVGFWPKILITRDGLVNGCFWSRASVKRHGQHVLAQYALLCEIQQHPVPLQPGLFLRDAIAKGRLVAIRARRICWAHKVQVRLGLPKIALRYAIDPPCLPFPGLAVVGGPTWQTSNKTHD